MPNAKNLLDEIISVGARSAVSPRTIRRYFNADVNEIPTIVRRGITPSNAFASASNLDYSDGESLMMAAAPDVLTSRGPVQVQVDIPKEDYRRYSLANWDEEPDYVGHERRSVTEPYLSPEYPETFEDLRRLPISDGGRVAYYERPIPRDYVTRICVGNDCYDRGDLEKLTKRQMWAKFGYGDLSGQNANNYVIVDNAGNVVGGGEGGYYNRDQAKAFANHRNAYGIGNVPWSIAQDPNYIGK